MIDQATKDRILDAVRIEEVIGDFVSLKKHGTNYVGLCPFHQDKNPSMSVSSTKNIFKCFSCGKAGTAVSFIMEHEHMTYPEALKYLAAKYHIEVHEKEETPEEIARKKKYDSLMVVSEFASKFYQDILWNNEYGRAVGLSYFRERQFTDETIRKFGLGYAHNRPLTLAAEAVKQGYKKEYLVDSGLCVERDNGTLADRFFDRVMFPIYSISGRVIAFGGRTLRTDKTVAKYVNSPQTEIYDKSRSLYGLFQAKNAIAKADKCILVEGYADVISMHQSGICNVVASSGTSLTVEQIRMIKRFTNNVTVIYDGDEAGIKAALRGTDLILEEGMTVKVVLLPPEDDPDSFAKAHSYDEIIDYIASNECDFVDFKSDVLAKRMGTDPIAKARMINDIIQTVSVIPDPILRSVYGEAVAVKFGQNTDTVFQLISEMRDRRKEMERKRKAWSPDGQYQPAPQYRPQPQSYGTGGEVPPPPEDEPVPSDDGYDEPYEPDISDISDSLPPAEDYSLTNPYLAFQERELTYYLLKFGSSMLHLVAENGDPSQTVSVRVDDYIRDSLEYDEIVFDNRLYRDIFNEYLSYSQGLTEDGEVRQQMIVRHFTNMENQTIVAQVLNLLLDDHPLTVKVFREAIEPEESRLSELVPKSVSLYKSRITEQKCTELTRQIERAQSLGDEVLLNDLIGRLQALNQIKLRFAKGLNRI